MLFLVEGKDATALSAVPEKIPPTQGFFDMSSALFRRIEGCRPPFLNLFVYFIIEFSNFLLYDIKFFHTLDQIFFSNPDFCLQPLRR